MKEALEIVVLAKDNTFYKIYLKDMEIIWWSDLLLIFELIFISFLKIKIFIKS